jgi:hypothetical protein
MSMGNFIGSSVVVPTVMAATNPSARESASTTASVESGVGMAHLTVVPTNFRSEQRTADGADR